MHPLLATTQRKVSIQFSGVPSGARYRRRFSVLCSMRKRNTPQFLSKVPTAKSLGPEVSNDQFIAQAMKSLQVGPLHSHLVRERPKIVSELYGQLTKFSKSKILHFRKLEQ
jgi:hypothetical protein